jgi:HTH-type transcriptional regulator/antitoxin HigA
MTMTGEGTLFGTPARIWNRLEADYRGDLQRIRSQRELSVDVVWTDDFPVIELVKREILPEEPADKVSRLEQVLTFFGVASPAAWDDVYADLACAFRTSKTFEAKRGALAAWLRLGEIAARDVYCEPFDRKKLEAALPSLRELTRETADVFVERMRALCAACGVAVVFVPELSGSRASGVTRWLTPAKALIQLSLRYKTDDHLWFTFFHEIGHVLRHGKTDVWIEATSLAADDPREDEADRFSRDVLIPSSQAAELRGLRTDQSVRRFADHIGVSPGVVVGRLQHDQIWSYSRGNRLKRPLGFTDLHDAELRPAVSLVGRGSTSPRDCLVANYAGTEVCSRREVWLCLHSSASGSSTQLTMEASRRVMTSRTSAGLTRKNSRRMFTRLTRRSANS